MAIDFTCTCGKKLRVKDELAGKRAKCPNCRQELTIPAPVVPLSASAPPAVGTSNPGQVATLERPKTMAVPAQPHASETAPAPSNASVARSRPLIDPVMKRVLLRYKFFFIVAAGVGAVAGFLAAVTIGYALELRMLMIPLALATVSLGAAAGCAVVFGIAFRTAAAFRRWRASLPPLIGAAYDNDAEEIRKLLAAGQDVNQRAGPDGPTALHLAVYEGHTGAAELLLGSGAALDLPGTVTPDFETWYKCVTPLHAAILSHHETDTLVGQLLSRGANVDARDDKGRTPLFYAAGGSEEIFHSVSFSRMEGRLATLLEHHADVKLQVAGKTALHVACERGTLKMVEDLIRHGADVNARTPKGRSPMHCLAECSPLDPDARVVNVLLAHGANINAQDSQGMTALMETVSKPYEHAEGDLSCFLTKEANLGLKNHNGETALDLAEKFNHKSYAKQIRKASGIA